MRSAQWRNLANTTEFTQLTGKVQRDSLGRLSAAEDVEEDVVWVAEGGEAGERACVGGGGRVVTERRRRRRGVDGARQAHRAQRDADVLGVQQALTTVLVVHQPAIFCQHHHRNNNKWSKNSDDRPHRPHAG